MLDDIRLFLMLLILESNHLYMAMKGIPAVRWMVELWCENIQGLRVTVTEEGATFYRVPKVPVEDKALDA